MKYCQYCGTKLQDGYMCNCPGAVNERMSQQGMSANQQMPQQNPFGTMQMNSAAAVKKKSKAPLIIIIILLLLAAGGAAAYFLLFSDKDDKDSGKKGKQADSPEKAIEMMFDAVDDNDEEAFKTITAPEYFYEGAEVVADSSDSPYNPYSVKLLMKKAKKLDHEDYEIGEELSESDIEDISPMLSMFIIVGRDGIDDIEELEEKYSDVENVPKEVDIEEAYYVTFKNKDSGETVEYCVYKTDKEGWKVDFLITAMIGYVSKSKQTSADAVANSLKNGAEAAMDDMENAGFDSNDTFIVSSDDDWDVNVPADFDKDMFKKYIDEYYNDAGKAEPYFFVIEDGKVIYAACSLNEKVGTYPLYSFLDKGMLQDYFGKKDYTIEEVYNACIEELGL